MAMAACSRHNSLVPALRCMLCTGLLVCLHLSAAGADFLPPPPNCGTFAQPCCSGNVCDDSSTCVGGSCVPCGFASSICCDGASCYDSPFSPDSPTCNADNLCVYDDSFYEYTPYNPADCGYSGLPCCDADACGYSLECVADTCAYCGFEYEPCCDGTTCLAPGSDCLPDTTCSLPGCGFSGLPCCEGDTCDYSYECVADTCAVCGFEYEPCCDGTTCLIPGSDCLPGATCSGLTGPGTGAGCGFSGGPCCPGDVCGAFATCNVDAGVCEDCGTRGRPCCPGEFCFSGAQCTRRGGRARGGTCEGCGFEPGQPCCGSTCFGGADCIRGGVCGEGAIPFFPSPSPQRPGRPRPPARPGRRLPPARPAPAVPARPSTPAPPRPMRGRSNSPRGRSGNLPPAPMRPELFDPAPLFEYPY
eukprot:jgi/Ulvmu1/6283/UM028_0143.1